MVLYDKSNVNYNRKSGKFEMSTIKIVTRDEAKDILDFITCTLDNLIINRQIYLDFHNALIKQKANENNFIRWAMSNYYQVLILNLCKLFEPKKKCKKRRTLRYFLNLCKEPKNWETLKKTRLERKILSVDITTNKEDILPDFEYIVNEIFDSVDVDADLDKLDVFYKELKPFRDNEIAHLTTKEIDISGLNFEKLHEMVDEIDNMITKYYHLFGIGIDNDDLKKPHRYENFQLTLK